MQIQLNNEATEVLKKYKELGTSRGIKKMWWDRIVSELILSSSETFWESKLEQLTPAKYLINESYDDEELQQEIVRLILKKKRTRKKGKKKSSEKIFSVT